MATWSSFEKDKLITEGWRKFLQEEEQIVFGINSDKKINPESLLSFLEKNQSAIGLSNAQIEELVALMLARTKEDDVVLEAIGGPQRDARTFSSDTTTKLNALIKKFNLESENERKLIKVLKRWAKLNTVSFEQGAPATPVVPEYEPDEDDEAPISSAEPEPIADEEEASTGETETDSSTTPEEEPAEKTPLQTFLDMVNQKEIGGEGDIITVELFKNFVRFIKSSIENIKGKGAPIMVHARDGKTLVWTLNKEQINPILKKSKQKYEIIWNKFNSAFNYYNDTSDTVVNLFFEAIQQVANSLAAETPADDKEEASTGETEPTASTTSVEEPAEKTVSTDTVRSKSDKTKSKEETETPSKVIIRMLRGKGVSITKINAFIEDIKALRNIKEAKRTLLQTKLGLKNPEYNKFKTKHKDVIKLINKLGTNKAKFIEAVANLIAQPAPMRQEPEAPTPDTSAETEPEAASPEPETTPDPEEEKQLDISQIEKNVLEAWRDYYNKDLENPKSKFFSATMPIVMKRVKEVIDAGNTEYGTIVRFADVRNSKDDPYNAFMVPKRRKEQIYNINKYYNIENLGEEQNEVRVKDIEKLAQFVVYNVGSGTDMTKMAQKGKLEVVGSENSEAAQPSPERKKEMPPVKNKEAYEHGKQGKTINSRGTLNDNKVLNISKTFEMLNKYTPMAINKDIKDKLESYRKGLESYQDELDEKIQFRPLFEDQRDKDLSLKRYEKVYEAGLQGNTAMYIKSTNSYMATGGSMSTQKAYKEWNERYDFMGNKTYIENNPDYINTTKPYLQGLKKYIEDKIGLEKEDKFLNNKSISDYTNRIEDSKLEESLMLRWKTIAGIK